jgi:hypothetical protein
MSRDDLNMLLQRAPEVKSLMFRGIHFPTCGMITHREMGDWPDSLESIQIVACYIMDRDKITPFPNLAGLAYDAVPKITITA